MTEPVQIPAPPGGLLRTIFRGSKHDWQQIPWEGIKAGETVLVMELIDGKLTMLQKWEITGAPIGNAVLVGRSWDLLSDEPQFQTPISLPASGEPGGTSPK